MGGVEKLSVCSLRELEAYGCRPPQVLDSEMLAPECSGLAPPMGVFFVKGWTRGFSAMTLMLCCYGNEEFRNSWPATFQQLLG